MKNVYAFVFACFAIAANAQIVGTWRLADQAGALAVGPNQADGSWWSNSAGDVTTRACLFDDSIKFDANGAMTHYMNGNTWLETWQGVAAESCGAPVAPHDGTTNAPYTYAYDNVAGTLTVNGIGAHIGLAKVVNGAEINNPANAASTITYLISFANNDNTMIADINFGTGWWRFIYERTNAISLPDPNVTFRVNMSEYTGPAYTGVFLNGSFNTWCGNCTPMVDQGNGVWTVTIPLPVGTKEYKFTLDGWSFQEEFTGTESCIDPVADQFNNRYVEITGDTTLALVCYNSCTACLGAGVDEIGTNMVRFYPNPAQGKVTIESSATIYEVVCSDLNGKQMSTGLYKNNKVVLNTESFNKGIYLLQIKTENGVVTEKMLVE
jgi:hypothetical protein